MRCNHVFFSVLLGVKKILNLSLSTLDDFNWSRRICKACNDGMCIKSSGVFNVGHSVMVPTTGFVAVNALTMDSDALFDVNNSSISPDRFSAGFCIGNGTRFSENFHPCLSALMTASSNDNMRDSLYSTVCKIAGSSSRSSW